MRRSLLAGCGLPEALLAPVAMAPSNRSSALCSLFLLALASGCAGPPIPSPIEDEPVCADVKLGAARTEMIGGLRHPVRVRILDGKSQILKLVLGGKRTPNDPSPRTLIADDSDEYTVEWAQCENERAPRPVDKGPKPKDQKSAEKSARANESAAYECGEAVVYKTEKLVTKKGDAASHVLKFMTPPKAECWMDDAPPPALLAPPAAPDAGAPPTEAAALPAADAGAASDAGPASTDAGLASDAGTAPVDAGAASDAGAGRK